MAEAAVKVFEAVCAVCQREFTFARKTSSNLAARQTCSAACLSALRQRRRQETQLHGGHCRPETAERIASLLLLDTTIGSPTAEALRHAEKEVRRERQSASAPVPAPSATCQRCGAPADIEECPVWGPDRLPCIRVIVRCSRWRGHASVLEERVPPEWHTSAPDPGPAPLPPFLSPDQLPEREHDLAPAPEPPITTEEHMSTTLVLNPGTPEEEALAALAVRPCADCGADLTGRHHKARYCLACRAAHDEGTAHRRIQKTRRRTGRPAIIACETCGVDVLVPESGPVPRYCPDCRGSRKAEPCLEPASLTTPEAEPEPELPVEEIHDEADADDSPTLPDMAAQLLEWMPHLLALPEEEADLVVRLARAEARRRSA